MQLVNDPSNFTLSELSYYFQYPINEAAEKLGICATVLKKICRKNGVSRWPHRKIKSIDSMIDSLKDVMEKHPESVHTLGLDLDDLLQKRQYLLENPNVSYKSVVSKYCINAFNAKVQKVQGVNSSSSNFTSNSPTKISLSSGISKTIKKKSSSPVRSTMPHTTVKLPKIETILKQLEIQKKMPTLSDSVNTLENEAVATLTALNTGTSENNPIEFERMVAQICASMSYSRLNSLAPSPKSILPFECSLRASTEQLAN